MNNGHGHSATIWTASTHQARALSPAAASLCEEELAQARRLKQKGDRDRFVAARTLLRHALSEAVDGQIGPAQWRYRIGPAGKPEMAHGLPQLDFNISHAADCVAIGVSASGAIGVDIETTVHDDRLEVVENALSDRERAHLVALPENRKWATFVQFWTIKEACAKALGLGITLDFRELEITLDPPRVHNSRGLLDPGKGFAIETGSIMMDRRPYCLSVAKITEATGNTPFWFKALADNRTGQSDGIENGNVLGCI